MCSSFLHKSEARQTRNRAWWGEGTFSIEWNALDDENYWIPYGLSWTALDKEHSIYPVVDSFIDCKNIPTIVITSVFVERDEEVLLEANIKYFPHFYLFTRPYASLFERGGVCSERDIETGNRTKCIAAISQEFFLDGFYYTREANSRLIQPNGGYWSSPNLVGPRNWIWQWCMAPKNMHRYSYCGELESECLDLTFNGINTCIWNTQDVRFEMGRFYSIPLVWGLDNPETGNMTCRVAGGGYNACRLLSCRYDDENDYASTGGWKHNIWLTGRVVHSNVGSRAHVSDLCKSEQNQTLHTKKQT